MNKSKILLVSIKGSYNQAKRSIKKGITDNDYRKTLRDMTVQYWVVRKAAPDIGIVCGIKGNVVFSAFEVNEKHSYDEIEYEKHTDGSRQIRIAFNCDKVREDLIGIKLPEEVAFHGGPLLRTVEIEHFYDLVSPQYEDGSINENRQRVYDEIKADGLSIDNEFGKRQNYYSHTDYAQREYGNERDQKIRKQALVSAKFKCELFDCDRCDFCANLTPTQRNTIEVHHIDELHDDPTNNDNLENLVAICNRLHRRYHYHMDEKEQEITKQRFINIRKKHPSHN